MTIWNSTCNPCFSTFDQIVFVFHGLKTVFFCYLLKLNFICYPNRFFTYDCSLWDGGRHTFLRAKTNFNSIWFNVLVFLLLDYCCRILESIWFTWVAEANHLTMNIEHDADQPWLKLQLAATCDFEKSFFNDWFTGHLNFQIEHQ